MNTQDSLLDTDELLHLAINASESNNVDNAIKYLKEAVQLSPDNGKVHFLLGAMHAEIGLYDRAIADMASAIKYEPSLYTAVFQLGLLYMTQGNLSDAEKTWEGLDELGDTNYLYLFKTGLLMLSNNDFENAIEYLDKGISVNKENMPLNKDMLRVLTQTKENLDNSDDNEDGGNDKNGTNNPFYLNKYQNDDFDS